MEKNNKKIGVLFVCLGNICRSPSAQAMFEDLVVKNHLSHHFIVDSCGTAPFNVGKNPDKRAITASKALGYDIEGQVARQIQDNDYLEFDYILGMDRKNMMSLEAWKPKDFSGQIELLMKFHPTPNGKFQILDPYQESDNAFVPRMKIIEAAVKGLFDNIVRNKNINL